MAIDVGTAFANKPKSNPPPQIPAAPLSEPLPIPPSALSGLRPGIELPAPRRFAQADLNQHGGWILRRLLKAMPAHDERSIAGWLSGVIHSGDYLFLCQDYSVALAQVLRVSGLECKPVVREKFVFALEGHEQEAAYFYLEFRMWAKSMGAEVMVVEELTDVPHDTIKDILDGSRVFTRQEVFVKV